MFLLIQRFDTEEYNTIDFEFSFMYYITKRHHTGNISKKIQTKINNTTERG